MPKVNKILVAIFLLLLFVVVGEIGYYFFYKPGAEKKQRELVNFSQDSRSINTAKEQRICFNPSSQNIPINESVIESYKRAPKSALENVNLVDKRSGKIIDINTKGGLMRVNPEKYPNAVRKNYRYAALIKYKNDNQQYIHEEIVPEETLDRTKFFQKKDNQLAPINLTDFKIGDDIIVEEKINLLDKSCISYLCTVELIITKLVN